MACRPWSAKTCRPQKVMADWGLRGRWAAADPSKAATKEGSGHTRPHRLPRTLTRNTHTGSHSSLEVPAAFGYGAQRNVCARMRRRLRQRQ